MKDFLPFLAAAAISAAIVMLLTKPRPRQMERSQYWDEPSPQVVDDLGVNFAKALTAGEFDNAHSMLSQGMKEAWPPERLKARFEKMTGKGVVEDITAEEGYAHYANQPEGDLGGIYVSIVGHEREDPIFTFSEAVMVFVTNEAGVPRIREIRWGRP